ncbi:MAG: response regulator, partial [Casimicrobiaceae bacterium]
MSTRTSMPAAPANSVYLVEDSPILAPLLVRVLLAEAGVAVVGVSGDAQPAISAIRELGPALVIVDLSLRSGSGFDVLRALSTMNPGPVCAVLTNHTTSPYRRAAESMGVTPDRFFDKSSEVTSM